MAVGAAAAVGSAMAVGAAAAVGSAMAVGAAAAVGSAMAVGAATAAVGAGADVGAAAVPPPHATSNGTSSTSRSIVVEIDFRIRIFLLVVCRKHSWLEAFVPSEAIP